MCFTTQPQNKKNKYGGKGEAESALLEWITFSYNGEGNSAEEFPLVRLRSVPHSRSCHLWVCPSSCHCSGHHHVWNEEEGGTSGRCSCPLWSLSHFSTPEAYLLHLWESFSKVARTWFKKIQIKKKNPILFSQNKIKNKNKRQDEPHPNPIFWYIMVNVLSPREFGINNKIHDMVAPTGYWKFLVQKYKNWFPLPQH